MRISDWSSDVCSSDLSRNSTTRVGREPWLPRCRQEPKPSALRSQKVPGGSTLPQSRAERRSMAETLHYGAPSTSFPIQRQTFSRSEEHTSELQSLMRISYAVFCLKKKKKTYTL